MNEDALKRAWRLDTERLVQRSDAKRALSDEARAALRRFRATVGAELAMAVATLWWAGGYVAERWAVPHLALCGGVLLVAGVAQLAVSIAQLVLARQAHEAAPVLDALRHLERVTRLRARFTQGAFAVGLLAWVSAPVVLADAVLGVDLWRSGGAAWVVTNVLAGLPLAAFFVFGARRWPRFARLRDDLLGRSLAESRSRLEALAAFEREPA